MQQKQCNFAFVLALAGSRALAVYLLRLAAGNTADLPLLARQSW
jgi:hypothetical protein